MGWPSVKSFDQPIFGIQSCSEGDFLKFNFILTNGEISKIEMPHNQKLTTDFILPELIRKIVIWQTTNECILRGIEIFGEKDALLLQVGTNCEVNSQN